MHRAIPTDSNKDDLADGDKRRYREGPIPFLAAPVTGAALPVAGGLFVKRR